MDIDPTTTTLVGALLATILLAAIRLIRAGVEWAELWIAAASERSRRRNRRESSVPFPIPSNGEPEFVQEETTDMHELVELEREHRRKKKKRRAPTSPTERAPRRGNHHD